MLELATAAADVVEQQVTTPQGLIRVVCPASMIQFQLAEMLAGFMRADPKVWVILESTNRRVSVWREGFDLAIRVRFPPLEDSDLVVAVLETTTSPAPRASKPLKAPRRAGVVTQPPLSS